MRALVLLGVAFALGVPAFVEAAPIPLALHRGTVTKDQIEWQSFIPIPRDAIGGAGAQLVLAAPLPANVEIDPRTSPSLSPVRNAKREVIAFDLSNAPQTSPMLMTLIYLKQPLARPFGRVRLAAPIVAGNATQEIILSRKDGLVFAPDKRLGLVRNIGFQTAPSISHEERDLVDELGGEHDLRLGDERIYLRASASLGELRGVFGELSPPPQQRARVFFAAGGSFLMIAAALAVAYARHGKRATEERAEAALAAEIDGLKVEE
jgi:hypothetical protein